MNLSDSIIKKIKTDKALVDLYSKYERIFPTYISFVKREFADCKSFLDLGCGPNSPLGNLPDYSVGVEMFMPYLLENKKSVIYCDYVLGDLRNVDFKPKSFDCVIALDVVEHLTKSEGYRLIEKMERVAKRKVIIFTVNEFVPQEEYDGNSLQLHKSGWTPEEFRKLGFEVKGMNGLKVLRGELAEPKLKPKIAFEFISNLTQKITYYFPENSFQLLCIKRLEPPS